MDDSSDRGHGREYDDPNVTKYQPNISIDTELSTSFLNESKLELLRSIVRSCAQELRRKTKKRDLIKTVQKHFFFSKVFKTRGVQGICGLLNLKKNGEPIVFKISLNLDHTVEHENLVTLELNRVRGFCPHFVGNLGMLQLPVSNDFINNPENESLFKSNNDYFPSNILLIEYVSPISLYHLAKYCRDRKSILVSQMAQIMIALDMAQSKCQFVSYDAHLDNVLIRQVEEDTLFLYCHKGKNWLIPTYGFYPILIDMGSSYVKTIDGQPMFTGVDNYHNGLQLTVYDNLNDVHHLLITLLDYLCDKGYVYDWLYTRFIHIFRYVPILSARGWKQLPHDLLSLVLKRIKTQCPDLRKIPLWKKFRQPMIEVLNGLIILPWSENTKITFSDCLPSLVEQLQKISELKSIGNEDEILYVIRETIDAINRIREQYLINKEGAVVEFKKDWSNRMLFIVHDNKKEIRSLDLDYSKLVSSALAVADCLSSTYYYYVQEHCEMISNAYLKTSLRSPMDAAKIILQNATPSFKINKTQKIYIWDSTIEARKVLIPAKLSDDQLEEINMASIFRKGDLLLNMIN